MSNYFTTIDLVEGKFVGTVFNANTNTEVYKSKPYGSQIQASEDITNYLVTKASDTQQGSPVSSNEPIVNTVTYTPAPGRTTGRCCGR